MANPNTFDPETRYLAGVDFTSAPSQKKPITVALATLQNQCLLVQDIQALTEWPAFEAFLTNPACQGQPCDWIALDFPFSLPAGFLRATGWPADWLDVMPRIAAMSKADFEAWIQTYCAAQPAGHKYHFRPTDRATRSSSPMKLHYPPVGKMFYQGAVRLWQASHLSILPFRPVPGGTQCVEGYPALVARHLQVTRQPYKSEDKHKTTLPSRRNLIAALEAQDALVAYGLSQLNWANPTLRDACLSDDSGDRLDAVFCAVQASWASMQPGGGIPPGETEGWIVDPSQCFTLF